MNRKISFHGMDHSDPLEAHANEKLGKIEEMLQNVEGMTPLYIELWLKSNKLHPHHGAELHVRTPRFDLHSHYEGTEMYYVLDHTIDRMVEMIKKEKKKAKDKEKKPDTEKTAFETDDDKYTLGD